MTDISKVFSAINKQMGENTIQFLDQADLTIPSFSTGSLTLDLACGVGGIPRGRIIEVFGPTSAGKTTLAMLHAKEVQDADEGLVAFVDAEHSFNNKLATQYGINLSKMVYVDPKTAENGIDAIEAMVRSGLFRLIIVDSVTALTPNKIAESSIEQETMALLARIMSRAMQKLNGPSYRDDCTILFINQIREKPGVMYGNPETTPGGRALPFYSSVRLHVRAGEQIKQGDDVIGHLMKVKVVKNKVGIPFKEAAFPLIYGEGVDKVDEIAQLAILGGIISQGGAWFSYKNQETGEVVKRHGRDLKFQGRAALVKYMREDINFMYELEARLRGVEIEAPIGTPESEDGYDAYVQEGEEQEGA